MLGQEGETVCPPDGRGGRIQIKRLKDRKKSEHFGRQEIKSRETETVSDVVKRKRKKKMQMSKT